MGRLQDRMSRGQKALVLMALDAAMAPLALLGALQLRLGDWWPDQYFAAGMPVYLALPLLAIAVGRAMGVHQVVLRSFENRALWRLARFALVMAVILAALNHDYRFGFPRSMPGIWAALFLVGIVAGRMGLLWLIGQGVAGEARKPVVIYGAGTTGQQLMAALRAAPDVRPVAFVDDNPALWRVEVGGLRVIGPDRLPDLIASRGIAQVVIAMPSASRRERQAIAQRLAGLGVAVMTLPSFVEMLDGRALADQVRPVTPDELLGRDAVDLSGDAVRGAYAGRAVMVTGAGGSIGSELCRQLLEARPSRLILFEQSELALYTIEMDLKRLAPDVPLVPVLGSVTDARRVAEVLAQNRVEVLLHAAAYKHVPMVEANALEGVRNNVVGTQVLADAAIAAGVGRFILVSTDKAVRPTNVMGASKRLAELVVQDRQARGRGCIFSMVRFGNVLGSSGSVIPLFRNQIAAGGPVTVTHHEVTRFFMTIPEAAQLVLLAGSFATGGEVFVLDMGQPVRIMDLARRMIELSGFSVRDRGNPDGDIEIRVTGLRPGEKLYEELLIGSNMIGTPHPKILRAQEGHLSEIETAAMLKGLSRAIEARDETALRDVLLARVDGYRPEAAAGAAEGRQS
jgi:FlaA1/EpsC-like NDP-sugar epimerase